MIAPMLFDGLDYTVLQAVGLESGYTLGTASEMYWDLASLMEMADSGSASDAEFGFSMIVESADQNAVGAIEAPEGAFVVPAQMLMSMMGS